MARKVTCLVTMYKNVVLKTISIILYIRYNFDVTALIPTQILLHVTAQSLKTLRKL